MMEPTQLFEELVTRVIEADDAYDEIPKVIAYLRDENRRLGGDDRVLSILITMHMAQISLPISLDGGAAPL